MSDENVTLETAREAMVADLTAYIEQETPSDDLELLRRGFDWVQDFLESRLGAPEMSERHEDDVHGPVGVNVYGARNGATGHVAVLCHYDTVWPAGTLSNWPVTIEGDRLTGPGCFDMKAGLVQFVWGLKTAYESGLPVPRVSLVLNGDEEIGSPASRPIIEQVAREADAVLVFEASADAAVKTARKGVGMFRVEVAGVESHAGLDPERGVSAIDEVSRVVRSLHDAADLNAGTSVNVGLISGGSRSNVTAGHAEGQVDVRVSTQAEADRIDALLEGLEPHNPAASIHVTGEWNRPVMPRTEGNARLYTLAREEAGALGFDLAEISVGGASDGNFASALGLPVLDGLGAVGEGAHARHEWVSVDGMVQRAALAARMLLRLAQ